MKKSKWRYAITSAPANGLNKITIPKATECEENMNEKFLFHLLSCHGRSGRVSSSSGSEIEQISTFRYAKDGDSIASKGLSDWIGIYLIVFVFECMKKLGNEIDKEQKEEFSIQPFSISFNVSVCPCPISRKSTFICEILYGHFKYK